MGFVRCRVRWWRVPEPSSSSSAARLLLAAPSPSLSFLPSDAPVATGTSNKRSRDGLPAKCLCHCASAVGLGGTRCAGAGAPPASPSPTAPPTAPPTAGLPEAGGCSGAGGTLSRSSSCISPGSGVWPRDMASASRSTCSCCDCVSSSKVTSMDSTNSWDILRLGVCARGLRQRSAQRSVYVAPVAGLFFIFPCRTFFHFFLWTVMKFFHVGL